MLSALCRVQKKVHIFHPARHRGHRLDRHAAGHRNRMTGAGVGVVDKQLGDVVGGHQQLAAGAAAHGGYAGVIHQGSVAAAGVGIRFDHPELRGSADPHRVIKRHRHTTGRTGRRGIECKQGDRRFAIAVDTAQVDLVDGSRKSFCQVVQGGAGTAQHLLPERHQARDAATGWATQSQRLSIGIQHQSHFLGRCGIEIGTDRHRLVSDDHQILVDRRAQADGDGTVQIKFGVDMRQFGHVAQQLIALVQQAGWLGVGGALLGELGVHHGHLLGQRVDLVYLAL